MAAGAAETIEVQRGRLYWSCVRVRPVDTADAHYFCTDDSLVYDPYYGDFGPLNVSLITKYCRLLNSKLAEPTLERKRLVHCCRPQHDTRANSVMLMCCWSLLYDKKSPEEAFAPFTGLRPVLCPYRDASLGPPCFNLTVLHCLMGLAFGRQHGWYDPETFDVKAYDYYERVENGDFNWIVPGKFLAFRYGYVSLPKCGKGIHVFLWRRYKNTDNASRLVPPVFDRNTCMCKVKVLVKLAEYE